MSVTTATAEEWVTEKTFEGPDQPAACVAQLWLLVFIQNLSPCCQEVIASVLGQRSVCRRITWDLVKPSETPGNIK